MRLVLHYGIAFAVGIALVIAGYFFFNGILNIPEERTFAAQVVYGSLIISTMFTVMTVPYDAAMNAHENMKYYAIVGILESLLKLAVAFACVYTTHDKLIVYGSLMACIPLVTLTIMRVYCHRHYEECTIRIRKYWDRGLMKEMTGFAGWSFFSTISGIVTQYGLGIIINHFWGVILNAAQGIANQISGTLMTFSQNALKALNPIIVKSEGIKDNRKLIYTTLLGCRISFAIFGFFSFPFIFYMPTILRIWLQNTPEWSIIFCRLQLIRILVEQLTISLGSAISAHGKIKYYSISRSIIISSPIIILPFFFYANFPPYWMYIIWILCWSVIGGIIGIIFCRRLVDLPILLFTRTIIIPCSLVSIITIISYLCITMLFQTEAFNTNETNQFIFGSLIISTTYCVLSYLFILNKYERSILKNIIKSTLSKYFK